MGCSRSLSFRCCGHSVRRIRFVVARSDRGSRELCRAPRRVAAGAASESAPEDEVGILERGAAVVGEGAAVEGVEAVMAGLLEVATGDS